MTITRQVYTVGPEYAHADARKAPTLDGKVARDAGGKELRCPVVLLEHEKALAKKVCVTSITSLE